jgi:hypothetical protein
VPFPREVDLLFAPAVFYRSAEHYMVFCNNIKKSAKSQFRLSKNYSAENPSPESYTDLKRTWTDAILKKSILKWSSDQK